MTTYVNIDQLRAQQKHLGPVITTRLAEARAAVRLTPEDAQHALRVEQLVWAGGQLNLSITEWEACLAAKKAKDNPKANTAFAQSEALYIDAHQYAYNGTVPAPAPKADANKAGNDRGDKTPAPEADDTAANPVPTPDPVPAPKADDEAPGAPKTDMDRIMARFDKSDTLCTERFDALGNRMTALEESALPADIVAVLKQYTPDQINAVLGGTRGNMGLENEDIKILDMLRRVLAFYTEEQLVSMFATLETANRWSTGIGRVRRPRRTEPNTTNDDGTN